MHLKTTVSVPGIGDVDVSTVDLAIHGWGATGIETCIFFPGGESEVVAHYASHAEAEAGHKAFSFPQVIGYVFAALRDRQVFQPGSLASHDPAPFDPVINDPIPLRSSSADSH